jgi:hypothetical protein
LPGEDEALYRARLDAWTIDLAPRDEAERFLVARAVHLSWQLDRVARAMEVRRAAARHADADRLAAEAEEVVAIGRRLFWVAAGPPCLYPQAAPPGEEPSRVSFSGDPADPDDPARLVVRLEATALGCAWLLDRWAELRAILEDGLTWQPQDRLKAVRMLGRQPLEAADDRRVMGIYLDCWAMDPEERHGFGELFAELTATERTAVVERLNSRDPLEGRSQAPEAGLAGLLALIAEEEGRLEAALADHLERAEAAAAREAFDEGPDGERLRRYEQSADRTLLRIIETLRKRQGQAEGTESQGGRGSVRVGGGPVPTGDAPPEASERTEEDAQDRTPCAAETLGLSSAAPHEPTEDAGALEPPQPSPARAEPLPPADLAPEAARSALAVGAVTRDSPSGAPAASACSLAGAVLALIAMLIVAGGSVAWAPPKPAPPSDGLDRRTSRIARHEGYAPPDPGSWLCSFGPTSRDVRRNAWRPPADRPGSLG